MISVEKYRILLHMISVEISHCWQVTNGACWWY